MDRMSHTVEKCSQSVKSTEWTTSAVYWHALKPTVIITEIQILVASPSSPLGSLSQKYAWNEEWSAAWAATHSSQAKNAWGNGTVLSVWRQTDAAQLPHCCHTQRGASVEDLSHPWVMTTSKDKKKHVYFISRGDSSLFTWKSVEILIMKIHSSPKVQFQSFQRYNN